MGSREVNETLATFLARIDAAEVPVRNGIIFARDVRIPVLRDGANDAIVKTPIAWPLVNYGLFYIVEVPAGTIIPPHAHNEALFRLLLSGDLNINGIDVEHGEWFVVLAGVEYTISTKNGYRAQSGYVSNCQTSRATNIHLEVDDL